MNVRWWWLGPNYRTWSDAEFKAWFLIVGSVFTLLTILLWIQSYILDRFFHNHPRWIEFPLGIVVVVASGYVVTGLYRILFPNLMAEAEANYSKSVRDVQHKYRGDDRK
jgi:hypothetical protein